MTKQNIVFKAIAVVLVSTNVIAAGMALHYRRASIESKQDFEQAIAEQERMDSDYQADRKEGCQDEVDRAIKETSDLTIDADKEFYERQIRSLQGEISDQAATLRKLLPKRFKGEQASSYFIRLKQIPENLPPVVKCGSDGDCCDKNPERCVANNFRPY